jgi:hypothetical protein
VPIATVAQRNALVSAYIAAAPNAALFTADPGTTGTVVGEVTGGTPAYARVAAGWGAVANSTSSGTGTFNVPSGANVQYGGVTVSATAGTADLRDRAAVTPQSFSSQGTYALTSTYTQT